ncbi:MAG: ROK family protein [Streptosporangiales bacterium]
MTDVVAGVDIGGTNIAAGLVDESGEVVASPCEVPTPAAAGPRAVLHAAVELVRALVASAKGDALSLVGAGVGCGGVIDPSQGVVLSSTDAISGWTGTNVRAALADQLTVPVAVDNDIHAHALGEAWRSDKPVESLLFVAIGTGIGGSIVLRGEVLHGRRWVAGHLGHLPAPEAGDRRCPCGGRGHLESIASGPAMVSAYDDRGGDGLADLAEVVTRAESGDLLARAVLEEGAAAVGSAIGGMVNVLSPHLVLVGGGVPETGALWWEPMWAAEQRAVLSLVADTPIRPAALGKRAAVVGAAKLCWDVL